MHTLRLVRSHLFKQKTTRLEAGLQKERLVLKHLLHHLSHCVTLRHKAPARTVPCCQSWVYGLICRQAQMSLFCCKNTAHPTPHPPQFLQKYEQHIRERLNIRLLCFRRARPTRACHAYSSQSCAKTFQKQGHLTPKDKQNETTVPRTTTLAS